MGVTLELNSLAPIEVEILLQSKRLQQKRGTAPKNNLKFII
jgi:hypothetical protein